MSHFTCLCIIYSCYHVGAFDTTRSASRFITYHHIALSEFGLCLYTLYFTSFPRKINSQHILACFLVICHYRRWLLGIFLCIPWISVLLISLFPCFLSTHILASLRTPYVHECIFFMNLFPSVLAISVGAVWVCGVQRCRCLLDTPYSAATACFQPCVSGRSLLVFEYK